MKLVAVTGGAGRKEVLREALRATKSTDTPLELLLENRDFFKTIRSSITEANSTRIWSARREMIS